jgi:uncharacterized protein (TIGR03067 family)
MRRFNALLSVLALLLVSGLTAAPVPKEDKDAVKNELAKLQGSWRIVSYEIDGVKLPDEAIKDMVVTFKDSDYSFEDSKTTGTIASIDPTKKPKQIDYKLCSGDEEGKTELAIYELDGDKFKDCIAKPGKDRPTVFTARCGTGQSLIVYERVKKK